MTGRLKTLLLTILSTVLLSTVDSRAEENQFPTVVSTSVCADQFVLMMADPLQIAGLSVHARDPNISPLAEKAQLYPPVGDSVEEIYATGADLVILNSWGHHRKAAFLERMGIETWRMPDANSYEEIKTVTRRFAAAINRKEKGEEVINEMTAVEKRLHATSTADQPVAVYFLPSGSAPGANTFVDSLLTLAGFQNYAAQQGIEGWRHIGLETLLKEPPDVFILSFQNRFARSARAGFAKHPRYRSMLRDLPTIAIDSADWICAGPFVTPVLKALMEGKSQLIRNSPGDQGL